MKIVKRKEGNLLRKKSANQETRIFFFLYSTFISNSFESSFCYFLAPRAHSNQIKTRKNAQSFSIFGVKSMLDAINKRKIFKKIVIGVFFCSVCYLSLSFANDKNILFGPRNILFVCVAFLFDPLKTLQFYIRFTWFFSVIATKPNTKQQKFKWKKIPMLVCVQIICFAHLSIFWHCFLTNRLRDGELLDFLSFYEPIDTNLFKKKWKKTRRAKKNGRFRF